MWPNKIKLRLNRNIHRVIASDSWKELKKRYGMDYIFEGTRVENSSYDGYDVAEGKAYGVYASVECLDKRTSVFEVCKDAQLELDF